MTKSFSQRQRLLLALSGTGFGNKAAPFTKRNNPMTPTFANQVQSNLNDRSVPPMLFYGGMALGKRL
jgi:hypothetical protein